MGIYRRKKPLVSSRGITSAMLILASVMVLLLCLLKSYNEWLIIFLGVYAALLCAFLFSLLSACHKYVYFDTAIGLYFLMFRYKEIRYEDFSYICICNASYNNGYGYGVYGNIPMTYKRGKEGRKTVYPFLTLHQSSYPIHLLKNTMFSRDLFMIDSKNIFCLGICWHDSLVEMLSHTDMPVYVLEDVYLENREMFDSIFIRPEAKKRLYYITEHGVESNY